MSLGEIVFNELENSKSWLLLRDDGLCEKCENKYLCPSVSNYELVIGELDLCHISGINKNKHEL